MFPLKLSLFVLALSFLGEDGSLASRFTRSVAERWVSPSRMTPADAADALSRHAEEEFVPANELFEAQKYLRTDGPISMSPHVLRETFRRRLATLTESQAGVHSWTVLPPLLHWLEWRPKGDGLELRGESVQVAVDSSARTIVAVIDHQTIHQEWTHCEDGLCVWQVEAPLWPEVSYSLAVPRPAHGIGGPNVPPATICDPEPSGIGPLATELPLLVDLRHTAKGVAGGAYRRIVCSLAMPWKGRLHVSYFVAGRLPHVPLAAAQSAVINNPSEVILADGWAQHRRNRSSARRAAILLGLE